MTTERACVTCDDLKRVRSDLGANRIAIDSESKSSEIWRTTSEKKRPAPAMLALTHASSRSFWKGLPQSHRFSAGLYACYLTILSRMCAPSLQTNLPRSSIRLAYRVLGVAHFSQRVAPAHATHLEYHFKRGINCSDDDDRSLCLLLSPPAVAVTMPRLGARAKNNSLVRCGFGRSARHRLLAPGACVRMRMHHCTMHRRHRLVFLVAVV